MPLNKEGLTYRFYYQNYIVLLTKAIQELNQRVVAFDPASVSSSGLFTELQQCFTNSKNNITDIFTWKVHAKEFCLYDEVGETRIARSQLDKILGQNSSTQIQVTTPDATVSPELPVVVPQDPLIPTESTTSCGL